jgi:hypothetical protein
MGVHEASTQKPCVIPVNADDALAWLKGDLSDADLLTASALVPEAVFLVNLPDRQSYKELLRQVRHWRDQGAVFLIARTGTPIVDSHMSQKNGCIRTFQERDGAWRLICPPDYFLAWLSKWGGPLHKIVPSRKAGETKRTALHLPGSGEDVQQRESQDSQPLVSQTENNSGEPLDREDQPDTARSVQG